MAIEFLGEQPETATMRDNIITPSRYFWFYLDDIITDIPSTLLKSRELPLFASVHDEFDDRFVIGYDLEQIEGDARKGKFQVIVSYGEKPLSVTSLHSDTDLPWDMGAFNTAFSTNQVVIAQSKAYKEDDKQFAPTKEMLHPATKEAIISDTIETHGILSFSFNRRSFRYSWKREFEDTINKEAVKIVGYDFPPKTLLLRSIGASQKLHTTPEGRETNFWQIDVEIEDFHKEIEKELALRGYTFLKEGLVKNIQLQDGIYDDFDQTDTSLNITSPVFVKKTGEIVSLTETDFDDYYEVYNDKFAISWRPLDLPSKEL